MRHQPLSPLSDAFPVPEVAETWSHRGVATWTRGDDGGWDLLSPPEDLALQPLLAWTDEQRDLLLAAFSGERGKYLEEGEEYAISWPPEGFLAREGYALLRDVYGCSEHDDEYQDDCGECQRLQQEAVYVEPAVWEWYVTVETWESAEENYSALRDTERLEFMLTWMDPRDVEYSEGGPLS